MNSLTPSTTAGVQPAVVRVATAADGLLALRMDDWCADNLPRLAAGGRHAVSVAVIDGCVVGVVVYAVGHGAVTIVRVFVAPHARRRKIGAQLVDACKFAVDEWCGGSRVAAEALVPEDDLVAQLLLKHAGFVWVKTVDGGEDGDRYLMRWNANRNRPARRYGGAC